MPGRDNAYPQRGFRKWGGGSSPWCQSRLPDRLTIGAMIRARFLLLHSRVFDALPLHWTAHLHPL